MSRHLLLVFANAAPGRDADFNAWYDDIHLPEALDRLPGAVRARRYRLSAHQPNREVTTRSDWEYLAMYEFDEVAASAITDGLGAAGFTSADGSVGDGLLSWLYVEAGPKASESPGATAAKKRLGSGHNWFLALTNPVPGREEEFDRWYVEQHIPEVVEHFPGLTSGQLFKAAPSQPAGQSPRWGTLAVYGLDADDVAEYVAGEPRDLQLTPHGGAMAPESAVWIYSAL
jgi:hypothetical protein